MKLTEFADVPFIKAVLKGEPGRAKTTAGLTFPQPMVVFDFDEKINGPRKYLVEHGVDPSNIDIVRPKDWNNNWEDFDNLLKSYRRNPGKVKTFGFDSYTAIADYLLGFTAETKYNEKKQITRVGGVQVAGIDEYNAETSGLMDILLFMKNVNAHVWLTAHVLETKTQVIVDGKSQTVISRLIATGAKKAAAKIPAYFPEVYAFNVESKTIRVGEDVSYYAYTKTLGEDDARTEFKIPMKIDFTGKLFFDVLMGEINKSNKDVGKS